MTGKYYQKHKEKLLVRHFYFHELSQVGKVQGADLKYEFFFLIQGLFLNPNLQQSKFQGSNFKYGGKSF